MQLSYFQRGARSAQISRNRMKRVGLTPRGDSLWTAAEEEILKAFYPNFSRMMEELPNRTYYAIRSHTQKIGVARKKKQWTAAEVSRLRRIFGRCTPTELINQFPDYSRARIYSKARRLRIRRALPAFSCTGFPIVDQIRTRCRELNYSMVDLDELAGTNKYFQQAQWHGRDTYNGKYICRAIEALSGTVIAQWSDHGFPVSNAVQISPFSSDEKVTLKLAA